MKTPMQMLIEIITPENFLLEEWTAAMIIKDKAIELLEEEKRQIEKAYVSGGIDGVLIGLANGDPRNFKGSNDYYNQTYNNENKQDTIQ